MGARTIPTVNNQPGTACVQISYPDGCEPRKPSIVHPVERFAVRSAVAIVDPSELPVNGNNTTVDYQCLEANSVDSEGLALVLSLDLNALLHRVRSCRFASV